MLREGHGARRCNTRITLTRTTAAVDDYGHAAIGTATEVQDTYAQVRQMSANTTMLTYQQADVIGVTITMRKPEADFDGITWNGHEIKITERTDVDNRGRWLEIEGYYQQDNPGC